MRQTIKTYREHPRRIKRLKNLVEYAKWEARHPARQVTVEEALARNTDCDSGGGK